MLPNTLPDNTVRSLEESCLNELRAERGLPPKSLKTHVVYGEQVLKSPGSLKITSWREERGFTYCNLEGGDSFGYYFPSGNPKVLLNFKGEPNYLIRQIDPEFFKAAKERAKEVRKESEVSARADDYFAFQAQQRAYFERQQSEGEKAHFVFRDKVSDQYYVGYYDNGTETLELNTVSSKDKAFDYLAQHGLPRPPIIPVWDYVFRPESIKVFDPFGGFVNKFQPSKFMRNAMEGGGGEIAPSIKRVIQHTLGDVGLFDSFLDWFAAVFQLRERIGIGWVLQGTTGTGKGILFNEILAPLLGHRYCRPMMLTNFADTFNDFMENSLILFIDEIDTDQTKKAAEVTARLKHVITEPEITIRGMHQSQRTAKNYLNIIMASNRPNSVRVDENDRRINVGVRQDLKLLKPGESGAELIEGIRAGLQAFANHLMCREFDDALIRMPINNAAKRDLQITTQTACESVADAILKGDLEFILSNRLTDVSDSFSRFDHADINLEGLYLEIVENSLECAIKKRTQLLSQRDLFVIFEALVGRMPNTKIRLTKRLGHEGIIVAPHGKKRGFKVKWKMSPNKAGEVVAELKSEQSNKYPSFPRTAEGGR